jgi:hypothetical protein
MPLLNSNASNPLTRYATNRNIDEVGGQSGRLSAYGSTLALQQVSSYLGYTDRDVGILGKAACDP